jgi:hypothetical protein
MRFDAVSVKWVYMFRGGVIVWKSEKVGTNQP